MKFTLVNGRTPKPQSFCALCSSPIGESYLRELATGLAYCDHDCYLRDSKVTDSPKNPISGEGIMMLLKAKLRG
jgi:hypothetical protein